MVIATGNTESTNFGSKSAISMVQAINLALRHELLRDPKVALIGEDIGDCFNHIRAPLPMRAATDATDERDINFPRPPLYTIANRVLKCQRDELRLNSQGANPLDIMRE